MGQPLPVLLSTNDRGEKRSQHGRCTGFYLVFRRFRLIALVLRRDLPISFFLRVLGNSCRSGRAMKMERPFSVRTEFLFVSPCYYKLPDKQPIISGFLTCRTTDINGCCWRLIPWARSLGMSGLFFCSLDCTRDLVKKKRSRDICRRLK